LRYNAAASHVREGRACELRGIGSLGWRALDTGGCASASRRRRRAAFPRQAHAA
jgi:hypothetical protein